MNLTETFLNPRDDERMVWLLALFPELIALDLERTGLLHVTVGSEAMPPELQCSCPAGDCPVHLDFEPELDIHIGSRVRVVGDPHDLGIGTVVAMEPFKRDGTCVVDWGGAISRQVEFITILEVV